MGILSSSPSQVSYKKAWLKSASNRIAVIHYACSDFTKEHVEISCIAVREFVTGKTITFSRADDVSEKELLSKFYDYVQRDSEKIYVGWNMKDSIYGFPVLERRYRELLKREPPKIRYTEDLDDVIKNEFGRDYIDHGPHGKLLSLTAFNGISTKYCIPGKEEAELHRMKNFHEVKMSTSCKVHGITNILNLFLKSNLKTKIGPPMATRRKLKYVVDILLVVGAILTIALFVIYLWG